MKHEEIQTVKECRFNETEQATLDSIGFRGKLTAAGFDLNRSSEITRYNDFKTGDVVYQQKFQENP